MYNLKTTIIIHTETFIIEPNLTKKISFSRSFNIATETTRQKKIEEILMTPMNVASN